MEILIGFDADLNPITRPLTDTEHAELAKAING